MPRPSDLDVLRVAALVIKDHGAGAIDDAIGREADLLAKGDVDGAVMWRRFVRAIELLQAAELGGGKH